MTRLPAPSSSYDGACARASEAAMRRLSDARPPNTRRDDFTANTPAKEPAGEVAVAAADIAQYADLRQILCRQRGERPLRRDRRITRHRLVEHGAVAWIGSRVVKAHRAEFPHEAVRPSVADHGNEVLPDRIMLRPLLKQCHRAQRVRMILPQQRAGFGQAETASVVFCKQTDRGERP